MMQLSDGRSPLDVVVELVRRSFDLKGRSRRTDGWIWLGVEIVVFGLADWLILGVSEAYPLISQFYGFISLLLLLPLIGWSVRRFHDFGMSGWWALSLVPAYAWTFFPPTDFALIWLIVWLVITLIPLLISPDIGPNRFGTDPRSHALRDAKDPS